ncbi:SPW repeat protein [Nocardia sp. NBC_00511]|uniref:SPW repeat protein n=1 Tax=Nocardia sp. NBC_00511 TaxID=2903591 RepID=UPI0030E2A2D6
MFTVSRAQDAVAVVLGAVAALSPIWVAHSNHALWSLVVLGVLIALTGLAQVAKRAPSWNGYAQGVLGILLFISPWVMDFRGFSGASWVAWIVGALTLVVGLASMPEVSGRVNGVLHH